MNSIRTNKPRKNKFNLSREVKQTGNIGTLMPCFIQDVIPGDSFNVNTQQMIRFSPLVAPMMHNIDFKLDYFFVPYRLVWKEWKDFITGGEDGNDLPSYPRIGINSNTKRLLTKASLADYLGVPPVSASNISGGDGAWTDLSNGDDKQFISALPFRAYQLIYHEYFRDQNVGIEYDQQEHSGTHTFEAANAVMSLRKTNWEKDYFTSALPFLQRGGEVQLPIGTTSVDKVNVDGLSVYSDANLGWDDIKVNRFTYNDEVEPDSMYINDSLGKYKVTLTGDTDSVTINELRKASALQQWLELMARAGSRYREQIFAIFGERIPDYTVQVPQYLGGGKTPIMISEVLSTYSQSETDRPQGDMSGHALGLGDNIGFRQSFDEHGIILGLCRLVPKAAYTQGLSKFWQKFDKFDHFFPQFANLGEQEVYNKELYVKGNSSDEQIFGYQQRYAEYKYSFNRIAGDFRDTLAHWELSRRFNDHPLLNQSFVEIGDYDTSRIFAVQEGDKIWMSFYHNVDALRPIPYHSNPQLS